MLDCQSLGERRRCGRSVAVLVGVAVLTYAVCAWVVPPELFNDTAAGYQVWLAMLAGGPFNANLTPDPANLAQSVASFQPWWAPGQYLVPGVFHALGLPLGRATLAVVVLASVLRILGYWRLWLAWGVPPRLAAECGIVAAFARPFSGHFGNAFVGDVLQAAAVPWLVLLVWRWRELRGWQCAILTVVFALAVGMKLSVLVALLALLGGLISEEVRTAGAADWRRLGVIMLKAAVMFVAVKLVWDIGYLRRGASIGWDGGLSHLHPVVFTQPLAGPLFSALGIQSFLNRVFLFPPAPLLTPEGMWPLFLAGATGMAAVVGVAWNRFPSRIYLCQVLVWLGVYAVAFTWFYANRAPVSFEERHYLPAGMMLLPCTVFVLRHVGGRTWRWMGSGLLLVLCVYGLASFAVNMRHRAASGAVGRHSFTHTMLTAGALTELHRLDATTASGTVFYVTVPEIALEVKRGRVITIPVDWWSPEFVRQFRFAGRASCLILVLPKKFEASGKVKLVKNGFPDYRVWTSREVDGFLFIEGG